jgi:hypothetical protein
LKRVFRNLTILVVSLGATIAHADLYTYEVTDTDSNGIDGSFSITTDPISLVTTATVVPSASLSAAGSTGGFETPTCGVLDDTGGVIDFGFGTALCTTSGVDEQVTSVGFPLTDYETPGNYTENAKNTNGFGEDESVNLIVTDIPSSTVPEPSSVILLLTALLAAAFVTRERFAGGSDPSTRMNS